MNLYLFTNHLYSNRKIDRKETIDDYIKEFNYVKAVNINNFIPNDGIHTTQIINYEQNESSLYESEISPSYCIAADSEGIHSRWWVLESRRLRKGQSELKLFRDVIADWLPEIKTSPSFITKGWLNTTEDNAIFNNESMTFNQIKKSETTIKDRSGAAWYVGYINKETGGQSIVIPKDDFKTAGYYNSKEDYPFAYWETNPFITSVNNITFCLYSYIKYGQNERYSWDVNGNAKNASDLHNAVHSGKVWYDPYNVVGYAVKDDVNNPRGFKTSNNIAASDAMNTLCGEARKNTGWQTDVNSYLGAKTDTQLQTLLDENGKVYQFGNQFYRISVRYVTQSYTVDLTNANVLAQKIKTVATAAGFLDTSSSVGEFSSLEYSSINYYIDVTEVQGANIEYTLPLNRRHTEGVPYDIIAIPATPVFLDTGDTGTSTSTAISKKLVTAIERALPNGESQLVYDFQLVPYCPLDDKSIRFVSNEYGEILTSTLSGEGSAIDYNIVGENDYKRTIILYAKSAQFSKKNSVRRLTVPTDPLGLKMENETTTYRLCSPNYNGQFEFSAAKNNGVTSWNISFTLKPFSPYIKVSPEFNRLYGKDFGDARGLICGGDFSIAQTNDAWQSYQVQNKNYQVMFDRQIQNMEVNNSIQRKLEIGNMISGTVGGAGTGAAAGMQFGGIGAGIGAVAGGAASAAGGAFDLMFAEQLRAEAKSYAKDQFEMSLQNIKALPYSITKVDSQNADYKFWPFVEKYTCSEVESKALENKLIWDGFTIDRIGTIADFLNSNSGDYGTYIQARPIRLNGILEDDHVAEIITQELMRGVYIK